MQQAGARNMPHTQGLGTDRIVDALEGGQGQLEQG